MKRLTLGSLFDGIGGFPLAAQRAGIKTLWASEIEPNCIEITKRHFPRVQHFGDITQIHGGKIPPVDIISFGSPCQDLSLAGAQKGLSGERSGLFHAAMRIIYEMREATNGKYPTFIIWENVPGAFSSNEGNDFRTVLEEITNARLPMPNSGRWATAGMVGGCRGGASVAWRQLDSQFWGVPQRRKRIFLVGDFRANRAPQILFECESLLGYVRKSQKKREKVAASIVRGIETSGGIDSGECVVDFGRTGERVYFSPEKARTITASGGGWGSSTGLYLLQDGEPITHPINLQVATRHKQLGEGTGLGVADEGQPAYTLQAAHSHAIFAAYPTIINDHGGSVMDINDKGIVPTLRAQMKGHPPLTFYFEPQEVSETETPLAVYPIRDPQLNQNSNGFIIGNEGQPAPTLSTIDRHAIAVCYTPSSHGNYKEGIGTLRANGEDNGGGSENILVMCYNENGHGNFGEGVGTLRAQRTDKTNRVVIFERVAFYVRYILRKLTPLECERLQGFPDYWTKYNTTGDIIADTPRYVALGNSLAVPCAERVFRGIMAVTGGYQ